MILEPEIYFFDMDHTLIDNDCDVSWKHFIVSEKLAGQEALDQADYFYEQYKAGQLDSEAFMRFQLNEFIGRNEAEMSSLAKLHFEKFVKEKIYSEGLALVKDLIRRRKHTVLLTATNRIIAGPLAELFGFEDLLATELEKKDDLFTGMINGEYAACQGKVVLAEAYCKGKGIMLKKTAYYGDSINDVFILDAVGFPYVVNPRREMEEVAQAKGWPVTFFAK